MLTPPMYQISLEQINAISSAESCCCASSTSGHSANQLDNISMSASPRVRLHAFPHLSRSSFRPRQRAEQLLIFCGGVPPALLIADVESKRLLNWFLLKERATWCSLSIEA